MHLYLYEHSAAHGAEFEDFSQRGASERQREANSELPYLLAISVVNTYTTFELGFWPLAGSVVEPWPPSALWEGVEERLSPELEVGWVTESWGFTSLELQSTGRQQGTSWL